ncbi:MAG: GatB/YqeY domain-containing protein [Deferrisomatales bacterium]
MGNATLQERIDRELRGAMKARDAQRVSALRMVRAALQNKQIEKRGALDDGEILQVLATLAKQRRESIEQYRAGGREDLAAKEEAELRILEEFLPAQLGEAEIERLVREAVAQVGARGPKDLGKVMGALMPRVKGRADGKKVNEAVRRALSEGETS